MFAAGDVVSGHVIDAFIGSGSSAEVYRVHRVDDVDVPPTPIALKILVAGAGAPERVHERFEHEFIIASMLDHPRIVAVYDRGRLGAAPRREDGMQQLWMTMQYIDGNPASSLIPDRWSEPDVPHVIRTARDIADALDYAHRHDVIHRDVKPANIIVGADEPRHAFLTDFGIAQLLDDTRPLARNGRVLGSIAYASPELLQAQQLTERTDLYALACTLCELLTGRPPFVGPTSFSITYAHIHTAPPRLTARRPWLPSSLDAVFAKALAKQPDRRYDTCAEFVDIVERTLRDVPVPAPERRRRRGRRR